MASDRTFRALTLSLVLLHSSMVIVLAVAIRSKTSVATLNNIPLTFCGLAIITSLWYYVPVSTFYRYIHQLLRWPQRLPEQEQRDEKKFSRKRVVFIFILLVVYSLATALFFTIRFPNHSLANQIHSGRWNDEVIALMLLVSSWVACVLACLGVFVSYIDVLPPPPPYRPNYEVRRPAAVLSPRHSLELGHVTTDYTTQLNQGWNIKTIQTSFSHWTTVV